ncbi:hypothetical protein ANN_02996 [Periplaneta americana]|uniref:Fasciculation and elongation protein zeta-2 n=1 Tax=Periplaneta americana TaxID=6978 RepID=A0ABQ8U0C9_PERAM|nr:hypothetical protein ANN_02996 [Periplaneta americana]
MVNDTAYLDFIEPSLPKAMWWTITGNFGNILPIDWSKSYARKLHMPALNLNENKEKLSPDDDLLDLSSEDEAVASDLDMHSLILSGLHQDTEPVKTAEEVIREIDDMMQETPSTECSPDSDGSLLDSTDTLEMKGKEVLQSPLYEDKLKTLSLSQLNELYLELEVLIREFSETLIAELALRDELEYEKELKNTFISLLLAVQNKRRQYHVERKRTGRSNTATRTPNGLDPKIPEEDTGDNNSEGSWTSAFEMQLKKARFVESSNITPRRAKRLPLTPGKGIVARDIVGSDDSDEDGKSGVSQDLVSISTLSDNEEEEEEEEEEDDDDENDGEEKVKGKKKQNGREHNGSGIENGKRNEELNKNDFAIVKFPSKKADSIFYWKN